MPAFHPCVPAIAAAGRFPRHRLSGGQQYFLPDGRQRLKFHQNWQIAHSTGQNTCSVLLRYHPENWFIGIRLNPAHNLPQWYTKFPQLIWKMVTSTVRLRPPHISAEATPFISCNFWRYRSASIRSIKRSSRGPLSTKSIKSLLTHAVSKGKGIKKNGVLFERFSNFS